jgi:hypothetical protein
MSVAPVNRAASNFNQMRNLSGRHGSMFWGRSPANPHEGIVASSHASTFHRMVVVAFSSISFSH